MNHPVETYGMRIMADGASVTYSADTGECPALVDLARNTDLLLCEAAFRARRPGNVEGLHLTGAPGRRARRAGRRQAAGADPHPAVDRPAGQPRRGHAPRYAGPVELAHAGGTYELSVGSSDIP